MSMTQKIFNDLVICGKQKTAAQMAAQHNTSVDAIRARLSEIRRRGYAIYANRRVDSKGREKTFYRHGAPTRAVIAAGLAFQSLIK